jgi:hypothetical protein
MCSLDLIGVVTLNEGVSVYLKASPWVKPLFSNWTGLFKVRTLEKKESIGSWRLVQILPRLRIKRSRRRKEKDLRIKSLFL